MSNYFDNIRPSPTVEDLEDPLFKCIFNVIKYWDINFRTSYDADFPGLHGGNGSDVMAILNAIRADPDVILGPTSLDGVICSCRCGPCKGCEGEPGECNCLELEQSPFTPGACDYCRKVKEKE